MINESLVREASERMEAITANICKVMYGKDEQVRLVVMALAADGHVLLEDVPGTGKTSLVSALAASIDSSFKRIQFTPDVMPSDVTGFSVFNQKTQEFEFRPGGVMSNIVLADEINRASAKTQSALLEAMEERQVTVDSQTFTLPSPFMVLATQNPIEQYGTYPLPEAQIDRFLIKLSLGYPEFSQELKVLKRRPEDKTSLGAVANGGDVVKLRAAVQDVHVSDDVYVYIQEIVTATRNHPDVLLGSSTRGGIALVAMAKAYALMQGRGYVRPEDVKYVADYTLAHRIQLGHEARVKGIDEHGVIADILGSIAVPVSAGE
ncbi:MoxR family ATPase [Adlercreutzia equolifaciens]|uniref:AAA family ATPase n=1 Tax=Adlercreutzia equolifaciens TaxID=446660 RepID=UPI0023B0E80C|nr:MoxR family ATPase [Adlercreutzia equolifaciens]MDE8701481.1 MoxR family ATPase [Adlercreutzia equolifaciens]